MNRRSHSLGEFALEDQWWSPNLHPSHPPDHDGPFPEHPSPFFTSPSPGPFHTPLSDSYLIQHPAPFFAYHVSTPQLPTRDNPCPRSMSVSALSSSEASLSNNSASVLPPPRQIRFVTTDGQPHTKRRRINAACLTCRKRKTRCSGERPECKTCIDNGHVCAGYAERPQQGNEDPAEDEVENEGNSGSSSPKRLKVEHPSSSSDLKAMPKLEKHNSGESIASARSLALDETNEIRSPASNYTANSSNVSAARNRVPYFRYFGPTAIVPGFKQMVVAVKDHRRSLQSVSGDSPASGVPFDSASVGIPESAPVEIPFYDATDPSPNAPLVTHLCEMFFTHLGCNYPFLQHERFMRDLEEKRVDAILVDAVCGVAARFSSDPTITTPSDDMVPREADNKKVRRAFRGHAFTQRAMSAVIDTFPCPTIAVAQACLLLAYEEFGTDHDSGLWMYLGTSIRMAQDLGIQKLQGLQLEGRTGPTPKTAKNGQAGKDDEVRRAQQQRKLLESHTMANPKELEDRRASEQERIDTFWAIFFLDRAVSSGVGRPVTLRDKDIEISFPYRPDDTMVNGWPHPFPPMIRIVHMYGRVADVLNNIKDVNQVTPEVLKKLASMEKDLTRIYQRLSPKLHFNATNFQHYVKAEQGTNFILLHFWFHTLIILVHQPTLLHSFEGRIQQLFPDSRELSMSSAKTIADILAFAELIDVKSFIGNPFTSQPMYVAACAFLAEAAAHASQPPSRASSPPVRHEAFSKERASSNQKAAAAQKHTLLASAANQNYQRCYKALKILDSYWAGCRYILTALDQKSKGLMDPLLFTADDVDGPMPSTEPSFTTPGWRRSTSHGASMGGPALSHLRAMRGSHLDSWSPTNWSQAIGWSLSGTTNSPQPNLSFLYPNTGSEPMKSSEFPPQKSSQIQSMPSQNTDEATQANAFLDQTQSGHQYPVASSMMPPPRPRQSPLPYDPVSTAEADLLLGLHSPYSTSSGTPSGMQSVTSVPPVSQTQTFDYGASPQLRPANFAQHPFIDGHNQQFSDMLIESQDVDMTGTNGNFAFPGGDMIPWLEYLPPDVLSYFGEMDDGNAMGMNPDPGGPGLSQGENRR